MKSEKLLDAIENIDDELILDAMKEPIKKQKFYWRQWVGFAACYCVVLVTVVIFLHDLNIFGDEEIVDGALPPHIVVDGRTYLISPNYTGLEEPLPDGFTEAGKVDVKETKHKDCPYYTNPKTPELVYVYHDVYVDGTVDEGGTLLPSKPHKAYVPYVIEEIRGDYMISIEGNLYLSMIHAGRQAEEFEYFEEIEEKYGYVIEGDLPEGFVKIGVAEFSGADTIPEGNLSSNKEETEVYYHAEEDIVLAATHWFTSTEAENGETRHDGFEVYIRCSDKLRNLRE